MFCSASFLLLAMAYHLLYVIDTVSTAYLALYVLTLCVLCLQIPLVRSSSDEDFAALVWS
jgi:hypothetical protein